MNTNVSGNNKPGIFSSKSRVAALALLFALLPGWALAWDEAVGRIALIEYGPGGNDGFSIYLAGQPRLCSADASFQWAFVAPALTGHSTEMTKYLLSGITAAHLVSRTVRLYMERAAYGCKLVGFDFPSE